MIRPDSTHYHSNKGNHIFTFNNSCGVAVDKVARQNKTRLVD